MISEIWYMGKQKILTSAWYRKGLPRSSPERGEFLDRSSSITLKDIKHHKGRSRNEPPTEGWLLVRRTPTFIIIYQEYNTDLSDTYWCRRDASQQLWLLVLLASRHPDKRCNAWKHLEFLFVLEIVIFVQPVMLALKRDQAKQKWHSGILLLLDDAASWSRTSGFIKDGDTDVRESRSRCKELSNTRPTYDEINGTDTVLTRLTIPWV